jgi:hypothetical protein
MATPEERLEYLRRYYWPDVSRNLKFPLEFVQSEFCLKSTFRLWLGIEPTKEEEQAFFKEARRVLLTGR